MTFTPDQIDTFPVGTQITYTTADGATGVITRVPGDGMASTNGYQVVGGSFWRQIATWPNTTFEVNYIPGVSAKPTAEQVTAVTN